MVEIYNSLPLLGIRQKVRTGKEIHEKSLQQWPRGSKLNYFLHLHSMKFRFTLNEAMKVKVNRTWLLNFKVLKIPLFIYVFIVKIFQSVDKIIKFQRYCWLESGCSNEFNLKSNNRKYKNDKSYHRRKKLILAVSLVKNDRIQTHLRLLKTILALIKLRKTQERKIIVFVEKWSCFVKLILRSSVTFYYQMIERFSNEDLIYQF